MGTIAGIDLWGWFVLGIVIGYLGVLIKIDKMDDDLLTAQADLFRARDDIANLKKKVKMP